MPFLFKPGPVQTLQFLAKEKTRPFSYASVGSTQKETPVAGFDNDYNVQVLGHGDAVWEAAKAAIRAWKMFPGVWACIFPEQTPIRSNEVVAMLARVYGLWWLNSCRIVYTIDVADKFGFAYGTLPGHAECGEELFLVEKLPDGSVRYVLKAFSRPRIWVARLAYPLARAQQRRFVRDSKNSMLNFVQAYAGA